MVRPVSEYRERARRRLPPLLFHYIDGGAYSEVTLRRNVEDMEAIALRQRVMVDVSKLQMGIELLGRKWSMPVGLGPVGFSGMYARRGEVQAVRAANQAGFPDYYRMRLALQEQDAEGLDRLLDVLEERSRPAYRATKRTVDESLSARYGRPSGELDPWHYADQFFQDVPDVFGTELDDVYAAVDLTGVAGRFSVRDLLESTVEPSKVISDQYGAVLIATSDGKTVTGRIVNLHGDGITVMPNMLDPNGLVNIDRRRVEHMEPSKTSMMPNGLLDTFKEDEILDLMAYLLSRGDRNGKMFQK